MLVLAGIGLTVASTGWVVYRWVDGGRLWPMAGVLAAIGVRTAINAAARGRRNRGTVTAGRAPQRKP
ncbi:hypothetical protein [Actinocatenispora thailandica]|uniref:hypothetical protein n=1 Tax=Actinocatenispora thailandica TaxID=227318 RepID=UPI001950F7BE|nr:hypothetical protein [Actinocatenispora thailandica]